MYLDADGEIITKQGDRSVAGFETTLASVNEYQALRRRVEGGEKGLDNHLFVTELSLGKLDFPTAKARYATLTGLSDAQHVQVKQLLVNGEVAEIMGSAGRTAEAQLEVGKTFAAMAAAERVPDDGSQYGFWMMILGYAESANKADLYASALGRIKAYLGDDARYAKMYESFDKKLAELRGIGS